MSILEVPSIKNIPEEDLWRMFIEDKNSEARDELILRHRRLVFIRAKMRHTSNDKDYEDIISAGMVGLIQAVDKFDPEKGVKFSSFAGYRISGSIQDYFRDIDLASRYFRKAIKIIFALKDDFFEKNGRSPTYSELSELSGFSIAKIREIEFLDYLLTSITSLDKYFCDSDNPMHETLSIDPGFDDMLEVEHFKDLMKKELTKNEFYVIQAYCFEERPQNEIGEDLGFSGARVSQILKTARDKIKESYLDRRGLLLGQKQL